MMKYLAFGIAMLFTGAMLMLYEQMWGEYLCIAGSGIIVLAWTALPHPERAEPVKIKDPENPEELVEPLEEPIVYKPPVQTIQDIMDRDVALAIEFICEDKDQDKIVAMYKRGPPEDTGFMWLPDDWFTPDQQQGFLKMRQWILEHDYDSSAYGCMHRAIQLKVREMW